MEVIPFVHEGLGNSSYLVSLGEDEAALIDPDRSASRYLQAAAERDLRITAVLETHVHADFVTGACEIAAHADTPIHISADSGVRYAHRPVRTGEHLRLNGVDVEVVGSPGHTPEHLSFVLRTPDQRPPVLFSGGSLIVGGAARTDLIAPGMTDSLTRAQYHTLHEAFAQLQDDTPLYPTHGGGSFCSAGVGGERTSTLGRERESNPLLRFVDEDEFTRWFPTTFAGTPAYYAYMRAINQAGPRLRRDIPNPRPLLPADFRQAAEGAVVVDTRPVDEYARAHVPGSLSNAFRPSFAVWLGWLAPLGTPLLFVTGDTSPDSIMDESLLVGHENLIGWLAGGVEGWEKAGLPLATTPVLDANDARDALASGAAALDVREPHEYAAGHIDGAINVPLGVLQSRMEIIPRDRPLVTYCGMGERSTSAASILERAGLTEVLNLEGGIRAWNAAGFAAPV